VFEMCEFKVFDKQKLVAQDIVHASVSKGALLLKDALQSTTSIQEALITEIDVANEAMRLNRHPIVGDMLHFLDAVAGCEESGKYDRSLEELWQRAKSRGDETIRDLWRKYEKPKQEKGAP